MRKREALMDEFSDPSPKKLLDDDDEETSDFIEHKKSTKKKSSSKTKNQHNRTFSSSSTGSTGSGGGEITQSSTSSTGSPVGGGYQSSGIYDGDSSPVVTSDNYDNNRLNYSASNSNIDKYKGISSRDMGKVNSMPSISESYENSSSSSYSNDPRIGTMKNNYYEQARKRQNEESGPYILQVIADMLKYIYSSITETANIGGSRLTSAVSGMNFRQNQSNANPRAGGDFPSPEIYLEPEKKQILEQFKKYCSKKFDIENDKHQKLLFSLYKCCTQKKTILTEGEHWKFLGFQNTKPETDFRGAGILGLRNLLYFSKHYKKRFKNYFGKCTNEISVTDDGTFTSYPFVIAGLNVTMLLLSFLGIGFQASKVHNVTAKKNFIELLTSGRGKPVLEEDEDEEEDEDSTPVVTEGTLLSFDDIPEQKPKKKGINILDDEISPVVWDNNSLSWDEPNSATSSKNVAAGSNTKKSTAGTKLVPASPVKISQKTEKKKKPKAKTETHQFNLDLFNEMYVVGFTCLHREWHRTKATYFDFGRVLDNARKHLEDLLELRFNSFGDVKEFNQSLKN
ncbi:predicted protein [Naegleria gruberi]|uniref:Predicted protein n=1 Tax=Naegleria gruberi TaxID=5762 RepID=D2VY26_NAEGR|nr:uncharacterized protein NAEGRDRAFT_81663 [Naegleria gruberi]EFC38251.1 predicted protein [Naegleria gruberi]|eukprot:XP_002670995.1 predicted protein [Naegleria gruberi strain NEG-M]